MIDNSIFSRLKDLEKQVSLEEEIYQDDEIIKIYERRKKDNIEGLRAMKGLKMGDKIWMNVDNLFMKQKIKKIVQYIEEDQKYLNEEIENVKKRKESLIEKLKILQN